MKILVADATRSSSTAEIDQRVAQRLHAAGHHPDPTGNRRQVSMSSSRLTRS